jgi:DNA-binding NarL/FixJ family response regulator
MTAGAIRVVVVDDDMFVRRALGESLDQHPDFTVVGSCENGAQALEFVEEHSPDVVLMDIQMPVLDGIRATGVIRAKHPGIHVLLMTSFDDDRAVQAALAQGASGFVLKSSSLSSLAASIRAVHSGAYVLSPEPARRLSRGRPVVPDESEVSLTESEREVLTLVCQGQSNPAIAAKLYLSESTVKLRLTSLQAKLGTTTRIQTAIRAIELDLVDQTPAD